MNDQNTQNQFNVDKNVLLAVTMISSFFNPFMGAAVNIALPKIDAEFSMNASTLSWISMSYLLSSAILLVPFGKLADILGRKKVYLFGNAVFTLTSLLCAWSVSSTTLIAFRILQGIGAAMIFSSGMAILTSAFPPNERGKVLGLNITAVYIGLSVAPLVGGILTESLGWRSIFYVTAAAGFMIMLGIIFKIKAEWAEAKNERFDFIGAIIYIVSVSAMMYGFSRLPKDYAIILTATGIVGFILFIIIELRTEFPVLNIQLFSKNKLFAFSNLAALINYAATFAVTFILSLYLQYVKGLSPREAGTILIAQPAIMALVASFAGRLSDKYDSGILSSIGMGIIVIGLVFLIFIEEGSGNLYIISSLIILGLGFGIFTSPNTHAIMSSVERKYLGTASATAGTMRLTGQMMSMAIATMIIHVFVGDVQLSSKNLHQLMHSFSATFIVLAILCIFGVFASLARGKNTNY
jgi:EmrB/QacA subfamily drug resistance transporter